MNPLQRALIHASYYPTLAFNYTLITLRIWRQYSWVDPNVVLGAAPTRNELAKLKQMGVSRVVNMCEEFAGDAEALAANGMEQLHLPCVDYYCPPVETLRRGVAFIQQEVTAGRKVFLHCKAGRLRSPCLAVCYLMMTRRVAARPAYKMVKAVRRQISWKIYEFENIKAIERELQLHPAAAV
jgi:atypical dual specificity phosphatase